MYLPFTNRVREAFTEQGRLGNAGHGSPATHLIGSLTDAPSAMTVPTPHFLLFSEARSRSQDSAADRGRWRFVLEAVDGESKFEAADAEPNLAGDRLELLAVVRGLEALEQPSRVTLVTPSRYVVHGLRFGLEQWRENDWQWERFGELTAVKNRDLWQRLDRALQFHRIDCRSWEWEEPDDLAPPPAAEARGSQSLPESSGKAGKRRLRLDGAHKPAGRKRSAPPQSWWGATKSFVRRLMPTG